MYKKPFVIAEAGCNHKGEMEIARELINTAAIFCKADAIKFQKRCPKELLTEEQYNAPHPNPLNSYGETYGEHREYLEFTVDQHAQLKEWCEQAGIIYSTSVCPLAKVMRRECKKRGIESLKVVYSKEEPRRPVEEISDSSGQRRDIPGSTAFVPSVVGLIIAGEVINDLAAKAERVGKSLG